MASYSAQTFSDRRISFLMPVSLDERHKAKSTKLRYAKYLERQVIQVWKTVTGATRKPTRASFIPRDFVMVTRRRSGLLV